VARRWQALATLTKMSGKCPVGDLSRARTTAKTRYAEDRYGSDRNAIMITTAMNPGTHDHHWTPKSRHRTSEGAVRYEQCACGQWRVCRDTTVQVGQTLALSPARAADLS
jgi:hypothetical protein